jgi:beta-lactamase superfamily II metal-dependent hydrolase
MAGDRVSQPEARVTRQTVQSPSSSSGRRGSVRVYRQGLGDCILVRLKRDDGSDFKLMIDCGVVLGTHDAEAEMQRVVKDIVATTEGDIDVLAITHEHWDHLSGFSQAKEDFASLKVGEVWVAWTEDPNDPLAKQLRSEIGQAQEAVVRSANALHGMGQGATATMLQDLAGTNFGMGPAGGNSTRNAFDLAKAKSGDKTLRLCHPSDLVFEIPKVNARIYVLGPPHDEELIRKINPSTNAPETYGLAMNGSGVLPLGMVKALFPTKGRGQGAVDVEDAPRDDNDDGVEDNGKDDGAPFHPRVSIPLDKKTPDFFQQHYYDKDDWRRIDGDWLGPAANLALALQSYTNNTSLVLAIELGTVGEGDVLLFAGDAQVGNWESWQHLTWPVDGRKITGPDLLTRTIFYKVGHHGSHNATEKAHGLELMTALKAAVIPVDQAMAAKKHWGHMPLDVLVDTLSKKVPKGYFLRTDQDPAQPGDGVSVDEAFFEVPF